MCYNTVTDVVDHEGCTIEIHADSDARNPLTEFDMLGTFACWHRDYILGHKNEWSNIEEFLDWAKTQDLIMLPLNWQEHGPMIKMSTGYWGRGIGYIYVEKEAVRKEWNWKRITKARLKKVTDLLEAEVRTYNDYLSGNVYGFVAKDKQGEQIESCWGFYGDPEDSGLLEAAKSDIKYHMRPKKYMAYVMEPVAEIHDIYASTEAEAWEIAGGTILLDRLPVEQMDTPRQFVVRRVEEGEGPMEAIR